MKFIIRNYRVSNEASQRLAAIPDLGVISATAITAAIGDAKALTNGRQLAAWLGLVLGNHHTAGSNSYWESVNEAIVIRALR